MRAAALEDVGDPAARDRGADESGSCAGEGGVGAGEGVDAVVVGGVREGADLVEELVQVRAAGDLDESILGRGGDGLGAYVFRSGGSFASDAVAAQDVPLVAVDRDRPCGAWF